MIETTAHPDSPVARDQSHSEVPYGLVSFWWQNLLYILQEQLWVLLAVAIAIGLLDWAAYHLAPRIYVSKATFMVDESPFQFTGNTSTSDDSRLLLQGILSSAQSEDMREIVAVRLHLPATNIVLDGNSAALKTPHTVMLNVTSERSSRVAVVEADSTDPELAAAAANAVLDELSVLNKLAGRIDSMNEQIKVVQSTIEKYTDNLTGLQGERVALEQKLIGIKEHLNAGGSLASDPAFANDPGLLELVKKRIDADSAYHAQAQVSVRGDQLTALRGQEENLENQMALYLKNQRIGLDSAFREAQDKIKALQDDLQKQTDLLNDLGNQKATLIQAIGDFKLRRQLFNAKLDGNEAGVIVVLDRAQAAPRPAKPSRLLYAAVGIALCCFLAPALMFLRHSLDHSVRSPLQIEWTFGAQCLAVLPESPRSSGMRSREINGISGLTFLRNQLLRQSIVAEQSQIITFTDLGSSDAGSWVAFLGWLMAQAGKPTLLIDLDFKESTLHRSLDIPVGAGLYEWVKSSEPLSHFICRATDSNLGLIQPGRHSSDLDLSLSRRPLAPHLAALGESWPYIFIYAPPLVRAPNLLLAAPHGSTIVSLAEYQRSQLGELREEIAQCDAYGFRFAGVILHHYPVKGTRRNMARLGTHRYLYDLDKRPVAA